MNIRFDTFIVGVIVILILMFVDIAGGVYYQKLKQYRSAHAVETGKHVPAVSRQIMIGVER